MTDRVGEFVVRHTPGRYGMYRGSVAADSADRFGAIYELLGLDVQESRVLAIRFEDREGTQVVTVYAVHDKNVLDSLGEHFDDGQPLPVVGHQTVLPTRVKPPGGELIPLAANGYDFLLSAFKNFEIYLETNNVHGRTDLAMEIVKIVHHDLSE